MGGIFKAAAVQMNCTPFDVSKNVGAAAEIIASAA